MLDFSFIELALCLVIALVVLGPERLPAAARSIGRWVGTAKGYMKNLSAELDRETRVKELRRELEDAHRELKKTVTETESSVRSEVDQLKSSAQPGNPFRDLQASVDKAKQSLPGQQDTLPGPDDSPSKRE